MELLSIFASIGIMFNDIFAILSLVGSFILLIGAFLSKNPMRKFGRVANWSIMGLAFGMFFQISMAITKTTPELIGLLVRMSPSMVTGLFVLSFLMLMGRWWVRRNRQ